MTKLKNKAIVIVFAVLLTAGFVIFKFTTKPNEPMVSNITQAQEKKFEAVSGEYVSEEQAFLRPLAVMVENHPDARPQSGLSEADMVYEALAEGGITRFVAIYQPQDVKTIGPVRSAREYFAQVADEWGALYAHVGGSNEVIGQIKNGQYKSLDDANEYYNFDFFPRRRNKPEPHHIFTSTEKLRELTAFHQFPSSANFQPWLFKEESPVATSTASQINIDFSRAGYEVGWNYDATSNSYQRLQYFRPHLDESTGQQLTAKTIVIQIVEVIPVPRDPLLSVDIDLVSGGRAIIFQDGEFIEGGWKKESGRTRFYNALNVEIQFNRGPIWIELVPKEKEGNITYSS